MPGVMCLRALSTSFRRNASAITTVLTLSCSTWSPTFRKRLLLSVTTPSSSAILTMTLPVVQLSPDSGESSATGSWINRHYIPPQGSERLPHVALSEKINKTQTLKNVKTIINKIGDIRLTPGRFFGFFLRSTTKARCGYWAILFTLVLALTSCSDDLDVRQSYPFTVKVMPYGDKITKGETVELRFEIKPEGNYANTLYSCVSEIKTWRTVKSMAASLWYVIWKPRS